MLPDRNQEYLEVGNHQSAQLQNDRKGLSLPFTAVELDLAMLPGLVSDAWTPGLSSLSLTNAGSTTTGHVPVPGWVVFS